MDADNVRVKVVSGIPWQLTNIMSTWIENVWPLYRKAQASLSAPLPAPSDASSNAEQLPPGVDREQLETLLLMGFEATTNELTNALLWGKSVDGAIEVLLNNRARCAAPPPEAKHKHTHAHNHTHAHAQSDSKLSSKSKSKSKKHTAASTSSSSGPSVAETRLSLVYVADSSYRTYRVLIDWYHSHEEASDACDYESLDMSLGLLALIVLEVRRRLPTLHRHCVICDQVRGRGSRPLTPTLVSAHQRVYVQRHLFGTMLKPSVCARDLCRFSFQQFGIGKDCTNSFATAEAVVDLLVSMMKVAAASTRAELILLPFPQVRSALTRLLARSIAY